MKLFSLVIILEVVLLILLLYIFYSLTKGEEVVVEDNVVIVIDDTSHRLAVEHIKTYEVFSSKVYTLKQRSRETGLTFNAHYIGYGHRVNIPELYKDGITKEQATEYLVLALNEKIKSVGKRYRITGNEALAVGMLVFNVGIVSVSRSELSRQLEKPRGERDIAAMRESWLSFNKYLGVKNKKLAERRQYEWNVFESSNN